DFRPRIKRNRVERRILGNLGPGRTIDTAGRGENKTPYPGRAGRFEQQGGGINIDRLGEIGQQDTGWIANDRGKVYDAVDPGHCLANRRPIANVTPLDMDGVGLTGVGGCVAVEKGVESTDRRVSMA